MLARRILALPVDGRPVVRAQVVDLLATAGWSLIVPNVGMLGHFRDAANCDALALWLNEGADTADGFVLSLDMLLYGGLVPSRFIEVDRSTLAARLATIKTLKTRFPQKPIYAFIATMRLSNNNVNEEEKTYWNKFGTLIWQWSFYSDRFSQLGDENDQRLANHAELQIPQPIREDYLATRERNFSLTLEALQMVEDGLIDRLILPQDDTAAFGFNIAERRALEDIVTKRSLQDRVLIYPGADEVIHTLCAHMVGNLEHRPALSIYPHLSDPVGFNTLRALYEDRPISESVACQISAVGAQMATAADTADVILAIHTSGDAQGDWAMRKPLPHPHTITDAWLSALARFHAQGKPILVLDVAYANGGDPALIAALTSALPLNLLAGYAGWNTASNSAGGLAAQSVLAHGHYNTSANQQVTALRLLEDYFYQAQQRQVIRDAIDESHHPPVSLDAEVTRQFVVPANAWAAKQGLDFRVASVNMPWQRTFEIDIALAAPSRQPNNI
jgi:Protein of unknown function (DUF4127)